MIDIQVLFPRTVEEQEKATRLHEEGKAALGEDEAAEGGVTEERLLPQPPTAIPFSPFRDGDKK